MQKECIIRICGTCGKPLPWSKEESGQCGWICCDEYFCSEDCLDKSFEQPAGEHNETWEEHFTEEGDCYYTDWELEEIEENSVLNA